MSFVIYKYNIIIHLSSQNVSNAISAYKIIWLRTHFCKYHVFRNERLRCAYALARVLPWYFLISYNQLIGNIFNKLRIRTAMYIIIEVFSTLRQKATLFNENRYPICFIQNYVDFLDCLFKKKFIYTRQ